MENIKTPTVAHILEKHAKGKLVVSAVGAGYVGAMSSIVLASLNPDVSVIVCDISEALIKKWNDHVLPFYEPGLKENFEVSLLIILHTIIESCPCKQEYHIHH
jgi:hypothetical protein